MRNQVSFISGGMEKSQQAGQQEYGFPFGSQLPAAKAATMKTRRERRVGPRDTAQAFVNVSPPWASTKEVL